MMHRTLTAVAALAALLPLAACDKGEPEVVTSVAPDPNADQINASGPVTLPPSIKASVSFRCKDNSLVYVDFFDGETQANLRTEKGGTVTALKAESAGKPYTGDGYTVTGNPKKIDLAGPAGTKSCSA